MPEVDATGIDWAEGRYAVIEGVDDNDDVVIYDKENGDAWVRSDYHVEIGGRS